MNNKNKVYQLEGGYLHDENGGKASAWMAASYVSALAAFTQWQKHTGCQAFESISSSKLFDIILSQKVVSGGDLKKGVIKAQRHFWYHLGLINFEWMHIYTYYVYTRRAQHDHHDDS